MFSNSDDGFWRFFSGTKIYFCEQLNRGKKIINDLTSRIDSSEILVLTDLNVSKTQFFQNIIDEQYVIYKLNTENNIASLSSTVEHFKKKSCQLIIAIGGGSVIDCAKLIAASLGAQCSLHELLENNFHNTQPISLLVIPTTFGAGSDVNNCTHFHDGNSKISIRHDCFTPWASLSIAEVALELPKKIRFLTAMDAWVHAIESHTLKYEVSPIQKSLSKEALHLHKKSFEGYIEHPSTQNAVDIATASLFASLCLNNSRTGLIHTLATPFAKMAGVSHAESLLPFIKPVLDFNWQGIKADFLEFNKEEFLRCLEFTYLVLANKIMQKWACKFNQQNIESMVEQCLMDTVIFKENPVPLEKNDLKYLYNQSLKRWLV